MPIIPGKQSRLFYGADPVAADLRSVMRTSAVISTTHDEREAAADRAVAKSLDIDRLYPSLKPTLATSGTRGSRRRLLKLLANFVTGLTRPVARFH